MRSLIGWLSGRVGGGVSEPGFVEVAGDDERGCVVVQILPCKGSEENMGMIDIGSVSKAYCLVVSIGLNAVLSGWR